MLIAYGNYGLSFAISSSPAGAVFLTDPTNMADGRSGTVTGIRWPSGAMTTVSYIQITVTVSSPLDTIAALGLMGLVNVVGLPEGTMTSIGMNVPTRIQQRLTTGFRSELSAWVIPTSAQSSNTFSVWIFNDVNGSASIASSSTFSIGEIFAGRLTSIPTLLEGSPGEGVVDPTQRSATSGGQFYPLMRKPTRSQGATLGKFTAADAKGPFSTIKSGGNPNGVISVRNLAGLLATSQICAVCEQPHDRSAPRVKSADGYEFNRDVIQQTMMLARPNQIGDVAMTDPPLYSWPVRFQEAT